MKKNIADSYFRVASCIMIAHTALWIIADQINTFIFAYILFFSLMFSMLHLVILPVAGIAMAITKARFSTTVLCFLGPLTWSLCLSFYIGRGGWDGII